MTSLKQRHADGLKVTSIVSPGQSSGHIWLTVRLVMTNITNKLINITNTTKKNKGKSLLILLIKNKF